MGCCCTKKKEKMNETSEGPGAKGGLRQQSRLRSKLTVSFHPDVEQSNLKHQNSRRTPGSLDPPQEEEVKTKAFLFGSNQFWGQTIVEDSTIKIAESNVESEDHYQNNASFSFNQNLQPCSVTVRNAEDCKACSDRPGWLPSPEPSARNNNTVLAPAPTISHLQLGGITIHGSQMASSQVTEPKGENQDVEPSSSRRSHDLAKEVQVRRMITHSDQVSQMRPALLFKRVSTLKSKPFLDVKDDFQPAKAVVLAEDSDSQTNIGCQAGPTLSTDASMKSMLKPTFTKLAPVRASNDI